MNLMSIPVGLPCSGIEVVVRRFVLELQRRDRPGTAQGRELRTSWLVLCGGCCSAGDYLALVEEELFLCVRVEPLLHHAR